MSAEDSLKVATNYVTSPEIEDTRMCGRCPTFGTNNLRYTEFTWSGYGNYVGPLNRKDQVMLRWQNPRHFYLSRTFPLDKNRPGAGPREVSDNDDNELVGGSNATPRTAKKRPSGRQRRLTRMRETKEHPPRLPHAAADGRDRTSCELAADADNNVRNVVFPEPEPISLSLGDKTFHVAAKLVHEHTTARFGTDLSRIKKSDKGGLEEWREKLLHKLRTNESGYFRTKHQALEIPESFAEF
ncbi:hypothetical protein V8F33_013512 [Rhypophila sp. PSN 637]